jgi:hypothetical protein
MLRAVFVSLLMLWLLGVLNGHALGGFLHLLLVFALIALILEMVVNRRFD